MTNQDVYLSEGSWASLPQSLPASTAFFLSRYHRRVPYDVTHTLAAGRAEGIFPTNFSVEAAGGDSRQPQPRGSLPKQPSSSSWAATAAASLSSTASAAASALGASQAETQPFVSRTRAARAEAGGRGAGPASVARRVCDMTAPRFAVWGRSLCTPKNFGAYDVYAFRLDKPLSGAQLDLFDYPQNAWGGENLFQWLLQEALGFRTANPCLSLAAVHIHCMLPTEFGVRKAGDRRLSKRDIIVKAMARLRALGLGPAADVPVGEVVTKVGNLRLNVTRLDADGAIDIAYDAAVGNSTHGRRRGGGRGGGPRAGRPGLASI